jgi:hypothetical protein
MSLQLVVEAQDTSAPSLAQDSLDMAQDSWPLSSVLLWSVVAQVLAPKPRLPPPPGEMAGKWSNVVVVMLCYRFLSMA